MDADIIAIQETRFIQSQLSTAQAKATDNGYHLFSGMPATKKQCGKYYVTDKLHPGVAFLVSSNLVAKHFQLPDFLDAWYQRGFLVAISVFLNGNWIIFLSVYVPLSQEAPALMDDVRHFLGLFASQQVVLAGDFNASPRDHISQIALSGNGFSSLGAMAPFDYVTYRTKSKTGIATSVVDDIIVSHRLEEQVMPCSALQVREFGHYAVFTALDFGVSQIAKFEVVMPDKPLICDSILDWNLSRSVESAWSQFCINMDNLFGNRGRPRGTPPVFKIRPKYKHSHLSRALNDAFQRADFEAVGVFLQAFQHLDKKCIKNWKARISSEHQPTWTRAIARWVRKPSIPMPLSIQHEHDGITTATVGFAEMLDVCNSFYHQLYNVGDQFILPSRDAVCADIFPANFRIQDFEECAVTIIKASSAARAPGLDGIQVSDFKALPSEGISAFARLSHQILASGLFPASWFNVKVVMIPKKEGSLALKDLRPLVIAPVAYRLFGKILLSLSRHAIFNVHSHSVGGIPKRRAQFAFLRVSMLIEHCRSTGKSFSGAAIDTQKFFDAVPHALAFKCLLEVGVPPIVVHTWGKYITSICRYVSVHGAISSKPICCDRGIPQGDPISMFAAAAALGLWLDSLSQIPKAISSEAWVFVDDRLIAAPLSGTCNWTQRAFSHTSNWDSSWNFITQPKTVCFGFGPLFRPLRWDNPDTEVASQRNPVYLGIPLPLPGVSRQAFFDPVLQDCLAILDKLAAAKAVVSLQARRYVVAAVVQKKLTYSASVIRLTAKQSKRLDSKVYEVVFHKALGVHSAAFALVLKGHQLQYAFAATYCSLCDWERYFALQGTECIAEYFSNGSKLSGIGPVAIFFQDLQLLDWYLDFPSLCIFNTQGQRVWNLGSQPIRRLQHNIREAYRAASLAELSRTSSSWAGADGVNFDASLKLHRRWDTHPNRYILERFLVNGHCTAYRLFKMGKRDSPECPYCHHEKADVPHYLFICPYFGHLRSRAPIPTEQWHFWPACASHCLLATHTMEAEIVELWDSFQIWACELFVLWYHVERENNAPEKLGFDPTPPDAISPALDIVSGCLSPACCLASPWARLPLVWKPFRSRTEWATWRGSLQFYAQLFLFWSLWDPSLDLAGSRFTWAEALLLYLHLAGSSAYSFGLPQAVYLFKSMSCKLLERSGFEVKLDDRHKIRWHADLPPDTAVSFATAPFGIPEDNVDTLVLLQQACVADGKINAYIHVPYFDMVPGYDSCLTKQGPLFSFLRQRRSRKSQALSWWSHKGPIFQALEPHAPVADVVVTPGAGLAQFTMEQVATLTVPQLISALGSNYMSSLAGTIRRWETAAHSLATSSTGCHMVVPVFNSDTWPCLGCNRPANLTRDPKWCLKSCPSPGSFQGSIDSIYHSIQIFKSLDFKIRFFQFPGALTDQGLPDTEVNMQTLEDASSSFSVESFAQLLDFDMHSPRLPVKLKECKLRWDIVLRQWSAKGHHFIPSSLLCNDGYCASCLIRPKNFQSFVRRDCGSPGLAPCHNALRHRLSSVFARVCALSLSGGFVSCLSWHSHAWTLFCPLSLILRLSVRLLPFRRRFVSLCVSRCCFLCCCFLHFLSCG